MKNIIKSLLLIMVLVLALSVLIACDEPVEKTTTTTTPEPEVCDHSCVQEFLPGYDATCTEDGLRPGFKCTNCGEVTKEQVVVPAHGHKMADATCTAPMICTVCGLEEGEALGHDLQAVEAVNGCENAPGYNAHMACTRCDYTEGKEVVVVEHEFDEENLFYHPSAPTCTEGAYIAGYCVYCEKAFLVGEVEALGHTWEGGDCTTPAVCSVCEAEGELVHNVGEDGVCDNCGIVFVSTQAELQTALDNAVKGTTIQLMPGVSYGVVYLRPSANADVTKVVDWVGNNYRYETYSLFEDLTILGAEGATIDAIEIEANTYYNTEHSQSEAYPIMLSLIELRNVLIEGVTFTGKGGYDPQGHGNALDLSEQHVKVDGLMLKNCVLQNDDNNARLLYRTGATEFEHKYIYDGVEYSFRPTMKNITVDGCVLNGGYIGIELRETENLTITNNEFNVADRNILLPVNTGCTYTGKITITGNVSNNAAERFVRADGIGMAELEISGNMINNYKGADADYIKVSGISNVNYKVEGNEITDGTEESRELVANIVHSHIEETIPGKAATCTEAGLTDGKKCTACGETIVAQEEIPAGHTLVDGICTACGYVPNVLVGKTLAATSDAASNIYSASFGYNKINDGNLASRYSSKKNGGKVEAIFDLGAVYDLNEFRVLLYDYPASKFAQFGTGFEIYVLFGGEWTQVINATVEEFNVVITGDQNWLTFDLGGVAARQVKFVIPSHGTSGWSTFWEIECSAKVSDKVEPEPEEPVFVENILAGKTFTPTDTALANGLVASWWKGGGYEALTDGIKNADNAPGRFSTVMVTTGMMDATIDLGGTYELHSFKLYTYDPAAGTGAGSVGADLLIQVYANGEWKDVIICADNAAIMSHLVVNEGTYNDYLEFDLGGIEAEKVRIYISASASASGTTYEEIECNGYQK